VRVWLDAIWSRLDQGFGVEVLHKLDTVRNELDMGQPIRMEVLERCLEGEHKGLLRTGIRLRVSLCALLYRGPYS